ncbi:MAG: S8 family serine peptidase [Candidatus Competibacterales bacterium]
MIRSLVVAAVSSIAAGGPALAAAEVLDPPVPTASQEASNQVEDEHLAKLGRDLLVLISREASAEDDGAGDPEAPEDASSAGEVSAAETTVAEVVVDAVANQSGEALRDAMAALGGRNLAVVGRLVGGVMPVDSLEALAPLSELRFARRAGYIAATGGVTSQGDMAVAGDVARAAFDVVGLNAFTGEGIVVGVISDSFDARNGRASNNLDDDVASGDLPGAEGLVIIVDGDEGDDIDEGRAMAQIIYDLAPGVRLAFHSSNGGQANFATAIDTLASDTLNPFGAAQVIVDDILYFREPMFQPGVIAQAAAAAVEAGVVYFSAAGNFARQSYATPAGFVPSGSTLPGGTCAGGQLHDFDATDGVDTAITVELLPGAQVTAILQWSDPFFSLGDPNGATADLDLVVFNAAGDVLDVVGNDDLGNDPVEVVTFTSPFNNNALGFGVALCEGELPELFKVVFVYNVIDDIEIADEGEGYDQGTIYGHANVPGITTVGASAYFNAPPVAEPGDQAFLSLNNFSSAGGTPLLFEANGTPLDDAQVPFKPEITGPDGVNNTFLGGDISRPSDPDGFPNFFGTSAAAPHAAAVAALLLEAIPTLTPQAIEDLLTDSALDITTLFDPFFNRFLGALPNGEGPDFDSGFGFFQGDRAVATAVCDLNGDLVVDRDDIQAQLGLYNATVDPEVVGDANNDGLIRGQDIRLCTIFCDNALCAPTTD